MSASIRVDDRVVGQRHVHALGAGHRVAGVAATVRRAPRAPAPSPRFGSTPSPHRRGAASPPPSRCPAVPVPRNATVAIADLPVESTPVFTRAIVCGRPCLGVLRFVAARWPVRRSVSWGAAQPPRVLRWAGDPEGGAPFVEADPSHPDQRRRLRRRGRRAARRRASAGRPSSSTSGSSRSTRASRAATPTSA